MAEYLGYVNPANIKANPTLDWGSVITDVQDALINQEKLRQEKRDVAEKQSAELNKELNNISLSRSQDVNDFLLNSVYKAKDTNLATDKLYKSGQISNKQMNIIKSNIKNGFNEFDALGKNISKIQEDYAKLSESGQASFLADYNMSQLGEALDLKNKVPYIDPTTGYMYVAPLDKNGAPDMNKLNSPKWMLSQADMPKKVDVNAEVSKYTKDLGKFEEILKNPPGGIWTIDDATKRPGFSEWLEKTASAIAFNPIRQASILGDSAGSEYKLTSDVNSNDKNSIIVKKDYSTGVNTPVLTKQQEEEAKNIVKNAILQQVNRTLKQQESTWHGFAPRSGGDGKPEDPNKTPFIGEPTYINEKGKTKGKVYPISGVTIKRAPGVVEQINRVGVVDGKVFIAYTTYNGTVGMKDGDIMSSYKDKKERIIYEDKNRSDINERLRYIGGEFGNIDTVKRTVGTGYSSAKSNTSSNKNIDEGAIQYLLKQNPGATRKQIIEALKNK